MPRRDEDRVLLFDISKAATRILEYTHGGRDEFLRTQMIQDAVARNLEIIGEAASKLSLQARDDLPEIPWRRVIGLRNVLAHAYASIDWDLLWSVIERDLPGLLKAVEQKAKP